MKELKSKILGLLSLEDISDSLSELNTYPPKKVLGPLFSGLLSSDQLIRWHCVTAMGHVTARMARTDMEEGRVIMRRLMWSLNDESGGIGWGAPECMGEIMGRQEELAREFNSILFSYTVERQDGADNYLEYLPLRRGAFWGMARLAQNRPETAKKGLGNALKALQNEDDPFILACLCRYFQQINHSPSELPAKAKPLKNKTLEFYWNQKLSVLSIKDICPAG
ncbi:MAG: DVU0298 family protein [Desulfonatronovibrio sp.]